MNDKSLNNTRAALGHVTLKTLSAIILLAGAASVTAAQNQPTPSTDRDNPAQLTSNVITGDGVDDKTEYFYAFTAGPGEVKLTLDVKAEKSTAVSSVDLVLFDANSRKLLSTYANPDHGSTKSAVETVKVRGEQTLVLDVTVSPGIDSFKIKLDGAIKIASSTPADSSATNGGVQSADSASQSQTADSSTTGSTNAAALDASASGTTTASQGASASQPSDAASASQPGAAGGGLPGETGKVNAKIYSTGATLSSIITSAGATADSVKSVKKKKNQ